MAKKAGKSKGYVSKGSIGHPRRTRQVGSEKIMNQLNAWKKGKRVKVSYNRVDTKDSGMPKQWAHEVWGSPFVKIRRATVEEQE
jgi:hypothetical protein